MRLGPSTTALPAQAVPLPSRTAHRAPQRATPATLSLGPGRAVPAPSPTRLCATATRAMHPAPLPTALRALPAHRPSRMARHARQPATPATPYRDKGRAAPAPSPTPLCAMAMIALPPSTIQTKTATTVFSTASMRALSAAQLGHACARDAKRDTVEQVVKLQAHVAPRRTRARMEAMVLSTA